MARSEDRSIANALSDLKTFAQISQLLDDSDGTASLRQIAHKMEVSPTSVVECLKRLNQRYSVILAETSEAVKSFRITEAGRFILVGTNRLFQEFSELERQVESLELIEHFSARIGVSPYLLQTMIPSAAKNCTQAFENRGKINITCDEAYETPEFIAKVERGDLDFAIVWSYQGRAEAVKKKPGLDCVHSRKEFDALVAFSMQHDYARRLTSDNRFVDISELSSQQLYVLREGHRFLDKELPSPDLINGGRRIESYSILSMLGSIRAGMPGVAIVPSMYRDLDRFRRDASIGFLPLKGADGKKCKIRLIYVFKTNVRSTESTIGVGIQALKEPSALMRDGAREFAKYIETALIEQPEASGWQLEDIAGTTQVTDREDRLGKCIKDIRRFKYCYYISSEHIGDDRPAWHFATADLKLLTAAESLRKEPGRAGFGPEFVGGFATHMPNVEDVIYEITGELYGKRIILLRGFEIGDPSRHTGPDCFAATLNFVDHELKALVGVWSGRDRAAVTPMAGPMVFSRELLDATRLRKIVHIAMVRQLTSVTGSFSARLDLIFPPGDLSSSYGGS